MVFVAGPRQVAKTTMALTLRGGRAAYRNRDVQVHATGSQDHVTADGIRVAPARTFLRTLV